MKHWLEIFEWSNKDLNSDSVSDRYINFWHWYRFETYQHFKNKRYKNN